MNLAAHSLTAIPFLVIGMPYAALGCVAADLTWVANEIKFRKSGIKVWRVWSEKNLTYENTFFYRIAHSLLIVVPVCVFFSWWEFLLGWTIHICLDLPTHGGIMQQQPFFPFSWKWKWILRKYK